MVDGEQRVYVQLATGLARFTLPAGASSWQVDLLASGAFAGSPSANEHGAFIVDAQHAVQMIDLGSTRSLGGAVDR